MTDNEIIRGIRDNSSAAWKALTNACYKQVRAQISPLLGRVRHLEFKDLFTEACLTLMDAVKNGSVKEGTGTNLAGYIYTVCQRAALRQDTREKHPKEAPRPTLSRVNGKIVVEEPQAEQVYDPDKAENDEKVALAFLDRVLKAIPEDCRKLFRRFFWDKMPM